MNRYFKFGGHDYLAMDEIYPPRGIKSRFGPLGKAVKQLERGEPYRWLSVPHEIQKGSVAFSWIFSKMT